MKTIYDIIVVILVYRNMKDLQESLLSIKEKICKCKIIIVNAYYDMQTEEEVKKIAKKYTCDLLCIENRGYGFGNNSGIKYADEHYDYKYIVISNPDIILRKFPKDISTLKGEILAPKIVTASGKMQNPMIVRECKMSEKLIYQGFKQNKKMFLLLGILLNKVNRSMFFLCSAFHPRYEYDIFAAHGSFFMLSKTAINKIGVQLYDVNMFLFAEESVLGLKAKAVGVKISYVPNIVILHKEDGSMRLGNISIKEELRKSNIYYYENYRMKDM